MNGIPYHRVASKFFNRPLLLTPAIAETISTFLLSRIGGKRGPRAMEFDPFDDDEDPAPTPAYTLAAGGAGVIRMVGEFVNRGAWMGASSGLISYEGVKSQLALALSDPRVSAIVLDLESPGGEATGAFEAAAAVRDANAIKPVVAVVNGIACSAAYAIASGAARIITLPTGFAGSIGVIMMHLDISKYLDGEGIKPTLIFAGAHKADGNPFEPLPVDVRAELQAEIDAFYDLFVATVALGRAGLSDQAIRDTQARAYMGQAAVDVGLCDAVGTLDMVLAELSSGAAAA